MGSAQASSVSLLLRAGLLCLLPGVTVTAGAADYLSFATDDEKNTTEIFSRASPSVVYVTQHLLGL